MCGRRKNLTELQPSYRTWRSEDRHTASACRAPRANASLQSGLQGHAKSPDCGPVTSSIEEEPDTCQFDGVGEEPLEKSDSQGLHRTFALNSCQIARTGPEVRRDVLRPGLREPELKYETGPAFSAAAIGSTAGTNTSGFAMVVGTISPRTRDSCRRQAGPVVSIRYRCAPCAGRSSRMSAGERHVPGPCRVLGARRSG